MNFIYVIIARISVASTNIRATLGVLNKQPLLVWPVFGIVFFNTVLWTVEAYSMAQYTVQSLAIICSGLQWIGIARYTRARKKLSKFEDDRILLRAIAKTPDSEFFNIRFFVPFKGNRIQQWISKLKNRTVLSLYSYEYNRCRGSATKFFVTTEDMFYLRLHGCIDTNDPVLIQKGMDYLSKKARTKFIR